MPKERIYWVDNLKGFLLLLVVLQHVSFIGGKTPWCINLYQAFHMPTFFFLSGLLFNPSKYASFKIYIRSKWNSLLKPYFFIVIFFSFLDPKLWFNIYPHPPAGVIEKYLFSWLDVSLFWRGFITHVYSNFLDMVNGKAVFVVGPMWFLWTLFWGSLLFYLINVICKNNIWVVTLLSIFIGFLGWILYVENLKIPFNLDVISSSLFFWGIGFAMKDALEFYSKQVCSKRLFFVFGVLLIYIFGFVKNGHIGINENFLGNGNFVEYVCASLGGTLLAVLSSVFVNKKNTILSFVAQNAIAVLAIHMWVLYCLNYFFSAMNVWIKLIVVLVLTFLSIPVFNKYLYFLIGKPQKSFRETFRI